MGNQRALCCAMQSLIFFRYQDIPVRYFSTGSCRKEFLFAVISYHVLIFLLEWANPGITRSAYAHSLEHWFDEQDAHRVTVSDELFEQGNGERKRWTRGGSPQTMERDLQIYELKQKHLTDENTVRKVPPLTPTIGERPQILSYDSMRLCRCVITHNDTWLKAARQLVVRLDKLGLGSHVRRRDGHGQTFQAEPGNNGDVFLVCICDEEPWEVTEVTPPAQGTTDGEEAGDGGNLASDGNSGEAGDDDDDDGDETSATEEYSCVVCPDKSFARVYGLYAHYDGQHRPRAQCECRVSCPLCEKTVFRSGLSQHALYVHQDELDITTCPVCLQEFASQELRDRHMSDEHPAV